MAPIDPVQLLKALDSLLSSDGGIRSIDAVPRSASVMKKFSKKLVSRCVYCNVLQATKPEILSEYLDKGGWETINTWLQYAKSSTSQAFLLEMLKLCKLLPMTLDRLKENNTAKLIKSLTKHDNSEVKTLANELVSQWMTIIKGKKPDIPGDKKKKKEKDKTAKLEHKEEEKTLIKPAVESSAKPPVESLPKSAVESSPKHAVESSSKPVIESSSKSIAESPKGPAKIRNLKRPSTDRKETKKVEIYEDVKIDPEPLMPPPKKARPDRPKTTKIYKTKFRATGLEEETPLPKNINKKVPTVDKSIVAAAKNVLKRNTAPLSERITEKKIKPENLMAVNENANTKGIKLIPAKPRPTYILQESASFIDALISQPVAPVKRKKKAQPKAATVSPTSPTLSPPKFQFYKDTLEINDESKKDEPEKNKEDSNDNKEESNNKEENENKENTTSVENSEESVPMDTTEEGGHTPPNEENVESSSSNNESQDVKEKVPFDPNQLRSILSHGKRRGRKKSVKWANEENIKEVYYFEMDETERVNVSRGQNFYDMKSIEMKREREAMEMAKRQAGDKVQELRRWWIIPMLIEVPPPLVVPGCNSEEKRNEMMRQQATLQEIYFTREMIPESPHEPDLEIVAPLEPKVIPLDEENLIGTLNDYSNYKLVKPPTKLPDILKNLLDNTLPSLQTTQSLDSLQNILESQALQQPLMNVESVNQQNIQMQMNQPYEPGLDPPLGLPNSLLGQAPPQLCPPPEAHGMEFQQEWRAPEMSPTEQFFIGFQGNQNMPQNPQLPPPQQHPPMNMRAPGANNFRPNFRGSSRGGHPSRNRVVCRYFAAGHCRFGAGCTFLHPGVNGPPL